MPPLRYILPESLQGIFFKKIPLFCPPPLDYHYTQ
jgi:hypothetical protein